MSQVGICTYSHPLEEEEPLEDELELLLEEHEEEWQALQLEYLVTPFHVQDEDPAALPQSQDL